jgi:hypothetical protein
MKLDLGKADYDCEDQVLAEIGRESCNQRAGSDNEGDGAEHGGHDESPLA